MVNLLVSKSCYIVSGLEVTRMRQKGGNLKQVQYKNNKIVRELQPTWTLHPEFVETLINLLKSALSSLARQQITGHSILMLTLTAKQWHNQSPTQFLACLSLALSHHTRMR